MLVKLVWRDCPFLNHEWGHRKINSFWIEASESEAEDFLKYALDTKLLQQDISINRKPGEKLYFLVAQDLSSIMNFPGYYPYSGQWNMGSPFEELPESLIEDLRQLADIKLPAS
ncbi:MAG TPA: hypothetical protein VH186_28515 [Chloroflexia bacterium]|nr:hypothetical protein [Chloroflexia bacterium]